MRTYGPKQTTSLALGSALLFLGAIATSPRASATGVLCGSTYSKVCVTVEAVPGTVTLARAGVVTSASYLVTITNNSYDDKYRVRFSGATTVLSGAVGAAAPFSLGDFVIATGTVACTVAGSTLDCPTIGTAGVLPRGAKASFYAVVSVPTTGTDIAFNWTAQYCEIDDDHYYSSSSCEHAGSKTGIAQTVLGTPVPNQVVSFVPKAGSTLFTGDNAVATVADPFTTRVTVVPSANTALTASVVEDDNGGNSCSATSAQCFGSALAIPNASFGNGLSSLLVITLRRDKSTIPSGKGEHESKANIKNAIVYYQQVPTVGGGGTPVRSCLVNGIYTPPVSGAPCIRTRLAYTKKNAPAPEFIGDWEFIIEAFDNGRFIM